MKAHGITVWNWAFMAAAVSVGSACGSTQPASSWSSGSGTGGSGDDGGTASSGDGTGSSGGLGSGSGSGSGAGSGSGGSGGSGSGSSGALGDDGGGSGSSGGSVPPSDAGNTMFSGDGGITPNGVPPAGFWDTPMPVPAAKNAAMFVFLNRTNGAYADKDVYWSFKSGRTTPPISELHSIADMPMYDMPANGAGRMYFYVGGPTSQYNDFIEFTIGTSLNINTTRVDAWGLPISLHIHCADGFDIAVGDSYEMYAVDRQTVFKAFTDFVPAEFKHLATIKAPYKIPQPGAGQFAPGGMYATYYDAYATQVWAIQGYTTPKPGPNLNGIASAGLSGAMHRHMAQLPPAQWGNSSLFYQAAPADFYAQFWHVHGLLGRAYGFPYDDSNNGSSYVSHKLPGTVYVSIGY